MSKNEPDKFFLILTVGNSAEPIVKSIREWKPEKVCFVQSSDSRKTIDEVLRPLDSQDYNLREGQYELIEITDHEDFSACASQMRSELAGRVLEWHKRSENHKCVADFTGGTKCMSAALALVARPWPNVCFSYVGGKRRCDGRGIVIDGKEKVVRRVNPWQALGYQVIEDAIAAFNCHAYGWGAEQLDRAKRNTGPSTSKELNAISMLFRGYELWDRLEYSNACKKFEECRKNINDLAVTVPNIPTPWFQMQIEHAIARLEELKQNSDRPTDALLEDLIANAGRRREENRHIDAVARLYRAVEVAAQLRLREHFEIDTGNISESDLPESMRERFEHQPAGKKLTLGLQDAYKLLLSKGDDLGVDFNERNWNDELKSPLSERNKSIAGHGFEPVSKKVSDELWRGVLSLTGISHDHINDLQFPKFDGHQGK